MKRKIIALSNGKRVANFSSPHEFVFTDGTILPGCSQTKALALQVDFIEDLDSKTGDVELSFKLSEAVIEEMYAYYRLYEQGKVDVVFCPQPMMIAIKCMQHQFGWALKFSPFRSIRIEDRIAKLVSIEKQCI